MSTLALSGPPPRRLLAFGWLWPVSALWLAVGLAPFVGASPLARLPAGYDGFLTLKSAVECAAFLWAARRAALGARLRRALRLTALAFGLSAVLSAQAVPADLGTAPALPDGLLLVGVLLTYVVGLAGILGMPMFAARRTAFWKLALDIAISVIGMSVVLAVQVTMPRLTAAHGLERATVLTCAAAQTAMLIGLNVLVLRGVAWPGARAFWLFVGGVFGNLVVVALSQFLTETSATLLAWVYLAAILTSLSSLWAAAAFHGDPVLEDESLAPADGLASFNPVPLLAVAAVAGLLLRAAFGTDAGSVALLAAAMVVEVTLVVARLMLTTQENVRLLLEEAEHERRLQAGRMEAVSQLTGGIAHWFNNLLTVVIGHAELGLTDAGGDARVRDDFARIRTAAERAARLTGQLLSFSGRQFTALEDVDVVSLVTVQCPLLESELSRRVRLEVASAHGPTRVHADPVQLAQLVRELVLNAAEAAPVDGTVVLRIGAERDPAPAGGARVFLPVPRGEVVVLEVSDRGMGIAPAVLGSICEPFFSSKPRECATGLGLAAVHGIVAKHRGGLAVESEPLRGTRVRVYLSAAGT